MSNRLAIPIVYQDTPISRHVHSEKSRFLNHLYKPSIYIYIYIIICIKTIYINHRFSFWIFPGFPYMFRSQKAWALLGLHLCVPRPSHFSDLRFARAVATDLLLPGPETSYQMTDEWMLLCDDYTVAILYHSIDNHQISI